MLTETSSESGLNTATDNQLVANIKSGKDLEGSLKELINRHTKIYMKALHKFHYSCNGSKNNLYDMIDSIASFFLDAANKFDETRETKFSTFIHNMVFYECGHQREKSMKSIEIASEDIFSMFPPKDNADERKLEYDEQDRAIDMAIRKIEEIKNEDVKKILKMKYIDAGRKKVTLRQMANETGFSIEWCRKLHDRGIRILRKEMSRC